LHLGRKFKVSSKLFLPRWGSTSFATLGWWSLGTFSSSGFGVAASICSFQLSQLLKYFLLFSEVALDFLNLGSLGLFLGEGKLELLDEQVDEKAVVGYKAQVLTRVNLGILTNELLDLVSDLLVLAGVHASVDVHRAGLLDLASLSRRSLFVLIGSGSGSKVSLWLRVDVVQIFLLRFNLSKNHLRRVMKIVR
jgi:hypothetical protein